MKVRKVSLLLALCVFALVFTACGKKQDRIDLTQGWAYSLTEPDSDSSYFIPVPEETGISNLSDLLPQKTGYIWVKKDFVIPASLRGQDLYCYLGTVSMADSTRINGTFVGGEGRLPPNEFSAWNVVRLYTVPAAILKEGTNTITVKLWCHGEGSISGNPYIGVPKDAKGTASWQRFTKSGMFLMFAFFMLVIAIYHILIFIRRPKERENLTFALVNILSVFYLSVFFLDEIPGLPAEWMNFLWYQKIFSSAMPFLFPFLVTSFILDFKKINEPKWLVYIRLAFLFGPVIPMLFAPDYPSLNNMKWLMVFILPPMAYMVVVLFLNVRKKSHLTKVLLGGFSPLCISAVLDIILHVITHNDLPYFSPIGWMLADVTLLLIMANRFASARNQAEYLNKNLAKKVSERTKKLSDSYAKLEAAKKRTDRDFLLAEKVQQSAYQRKIPVLDDWDVAFYFKPVSGISGDLYDFFISGKELKGLGLFDATGHGLATGLITMLAKNVVDRRFAAGRNDSLTSVMAGINDDIIRFKSDSETYMTGVLIRMNGNRLEYVNAGHPRVLKRNANGQVETVDLPFTTGKELVNTVLGIEDIKPAYRAINIDMQEGDALLLYTEALYNSRNTAGAEFGADRIAKAFAATGCPTAQDKLDSLLSIFNYYTKDVPQRDDLTVIVLQKKST